MLNTEENSNLGLSRNSLKRVTYFAVHPDCGTVPVGCCLRDDIYTG